MTPNQETSSGQSLANEYGNFGVSNCTDTANPAAIFGLIIGERGEGKTSLFRDCPGALIYNFDLHSMPMSNPDVPPPKAQIFPALNQHGQVVDRHGTRIVPTWDVFEKSKDDIIAAAKAGLPHPRMVVFDTLPAAIPLILDYVATSGMMGQTDGRPLVYKSLSDIPRGNPTMTAYGFAYDYVPKICNQFRQVGIGVWFIAHLLTRYISISPDSQGRPRTVKVVQHNVPEKVHFRYAPRLEFMGAIGETDVKTSEPGKPATYERKKCLVRIVDGLEEGLCARVNIPKILPLPAVGAWETFESAYLQAAKPSKTGDAR